MSTDNPLTDHRLERCQQAVAAATRLIGAVRDMSPSDVRSVLAGLDPAYHGDLAVVLAAMVPDDRTPAELLEWVDSDPVGVVERRAHREYERMRCRGVSISGMPEWVRNGERTYQRKKKTEQRARQPNRNAS